MSGIVVLILRALLAIALYAFLGWAFYTLWKQNRQQAELLATRRTPPLTLSIVDGNLPRDVKHFKSPEVTFGRNTDCECRLTDDSVSAYHARLHYHHGQWWLEDLGSTNGTMFNGSKLEVATIVVTGDEIRCGESSIIVIAAGDTISPPIQPKEAE
jgi:pSer/pThr/pTyr-binding forkhead associated (FHA) protein